MKSMIDVQDLDKLAIWEGNGKRFFYLWLTTIPWTRVFRRSQISWSNSQTRVMMESHAYKKRLYETNKTLGSLRRIFVFSWNSVKEQAYRSVIKPSLEHHCFVFNPNVTLINLKWSNRGLICSSPIDSGTHLVTCYNTSTGAYLKTDVNMFDLWYIK